MDEGVNETSVVLYHPVEVFELIESKINELSDYGDMVVYGKRDFINSLFVIMIKNDYIFRYADFDNMDSYAKDYVYVIQVSKDKGVAIEKAYTKYGEVIATEPEIAFIFKNDVEQEIVEYCASEGADIVLFDFEA